jgi:hypothetical protein
LVGKRIKAWNKRVYYAAKFLLIGGVLPHSWPAHSREAGSAARRFNRYQHNLQREAEAMKTESSWQR